MPTTAVSPPGSGLGVHIAENRQEIKNAFPPAAAPTEFDLWRRWQESRLDTVGQACRAIKLFGPGQSPARTRAYLAGRGRCTLSELRNFDGACAEFERFKREQARFEKQAERRVRHG